jgi:hypothetical protein
MALRLYLRQAWPPSSYELDFPTLHPCTQFESFVFGDRTYTSCNYISVREYANWVQGSSSRVSSLINPAAVMFSQIIENHDLFFFNILPIRQRSRRLRCLEALPGAAA